MTDIIINDSDDKTRIILKRGTKGSYSWELDIRGQTDQEVSQRITALNRVYEELYGAKGTPDEVKK